MHNNDKRPDISFSTGRIDLSHARADPAARLATLRAVRDAAQAGELDRAGVLAESALRGGLEHPFLLNVHALTLERVGRLGEAAACLRRAVQLAPGDPSLLNALGLCLSGLERPAEALDAFDRALAIAPGYAAAHGNRGAALEALGRLKPAEASYRRALELLPGHLGALTGLASLASRYGAHREARGYAVRVLEAEPNYPSAVMSLAAADLADGAATEAEARLRTLLSDRRPSAVQKGAAMGLLGDVLDAQGRIPEAFDVYAGAGDTLQRAYAPRYTGEGRALTAVRWMSVCFDAAPPEAWAPSRAIPGGHGDAAGHVFLLGFPRSGTTLLSQALAGHPDVEVLDEGEPLIDGVRAFLGSPGDLDRLARAPEAELRPLREAYWRRVHEAGARPAGKVFVDKHPLNTLKLPLIVRLFPQARILFARRDPRDLVLSCFRRRFAMSAPIYELLTLEGAAVFYDAVMGLASRLNTLTRLDLHAVSHERIIDDFDGEMGRVCAFLRLDWSDGLRDFAPRARQRGVATPSAAQLARGLSAEGRGQWRRYQAQMQPVLPILDPWIRRFGYDALETDEDGPLTSPASPRAGARKGDADLGGKVWSE